MLFASLKVVLFASQLFISTASAESFENIQGPLAEQIVQSMEQYNQYLEKTQSEGINPQPDHQTKFLNRINTVLIEAQENEKLKNIYFENLGKKAELENLNNQ